MAAKQYMRECSRCFEIKEVTAFGTRQSLVRTCTQCRVTDAREKRQKRREAAAGSCYDGFNPWAHQFTTRKAQ